MLKKNLIKGMAKLSPVILISFFLVVVSNSQATTLTISGTTVTMCGYNNTYDKIEVINSGTLSICAYGTPTNCEHATLPKTGCGYANISLGSNGNFTVDSTSKIMGTSNGVNGGNGATSTNSYQGRNGANFVAGQALTTANGGGGGGGDCDSSSSGAGGGGGFGGGGGSGGKDGGPGIGGSGGNTYGSSSGSLLYEGSGGGGSCSDNGGTVGGSGGSGIKINVGNGQINLYGKIQNSGNNGVNDMDTAGDVSAGGGGSGGHIILYGNDISLTGTLNVSGGKGGSVSQSNNEASNGGGGGAGRITIIYGTLLSNTSTYIISGGAAGDGTAADTVGLAGSTGTLYFSQVDFASPQYSLNSTNTTLANVPTLYSLNWTDDTALSGYIFSYNSSGTWKNNTAVLFNGGTWSNVTNTSNSTVGRIVSWRVYANDTSNNWNASEVFTYTTTSAAPPTNIVPQFSANATNVSSPQNYNIPIGFEITCDGCSNVAFNWDGTNQTWWKNITTTKYYVNITPINMSAGNHGYIWYLINASGQNSTENITFTINQLTQSATLIGDGSSSDYSKTYNPVNLTNLVGNTTVGNGILTRNGTVISNGNHNLTAGMNNITIASAGNQNYTAIYKQLNITINKATQTFSLTADGSSSDYAKEYSSSNSTNIAANNTIRDGKLERNGTTISSGSHFLGSLVNNITLSSSGNENYTAGYMQLNVTVARVGIGITLYLNGSAFSSTETRNYPQATNITAEINASGLVATLQLNGTKTPDSPFNITVLPMGAYNYTGNFTVNSNYSSNFTSKTLIIADIQAPLYSLNSTNTTLAGVPTLFSLNWTDNIVLDSYMFSFDNCTGTMVNDSWANFGSQQTNSITINNTNATSGGLANGWVATWSDARDVSTGTNVYPTQGGVSSRYAVEVGYRISRVALVFNTSDIPSDAIITSVNISLWTYSTSGGSNIFPVNANSWSSLTTSIFGNVGNTALGDSVYVNSFNKWWNFTLNSTGLNYINKTGITYIFLRDMNDLNNTAPTTNNEEYFDVGIANGGGTHYAQLFVTYTTSVNTITWSNITKTVNSTQGCTIRWGVCANDTNNNMNCTSYTNPFSYETTGPEDTCTYTSGNWDVNCADNCRITTPVDLGGNDISITGTGTFHTEVDIVDYGILTIKGTDEDNKCIVSCAGGCFRT